MRIFILCDYEGTTGTVSWDEENEMGPEAMAGDVNAAVAGLREGGFTKFVVRDYHSGGRTINPTDLDHAATLIRGKCAPFPYGLNENFDAMAFVGAHSMAGTATGVMSHTMNGDVFDVRMNGKAIGEIGGFALLSGYFNVPLILVTGDDAACQEARDILGEVETAAVKVGLTRNCAQCLHPTAARDVIRRRATDAAKRSKTLKPLKWEGPYVLEVVYKNPECADRGHETLGGERVDRRTIRLERESVLDALRCFERGFV